MKKSELRGIIKEEIESLTEDYGDVYTAMASSSSIRLLMKIPGVKRSDIKTRVSYNYGRYPKQEHHAYLAGFHNQALPGGHAQAQKLAHAHIAKIPKIEGVYYYVAL